MGSGCKSRAAAQLLARKLAAVHWEKFLGRTPHSTEPARVLTRKPGDRRKPPPTTLSREKENGMRNFVLSFRAAAASNLLVLLLLTASASAADLKVKVVDPQSAAVPNAQLQLIRPADQIILATQTTSAEGEATFHIDSSASLQLKVLAPGFAEENRDIQNQSDITIHLHIAPSSETIVVSATRTPVPGENSGAQSDSLTYSQLDTLQPVAASDALRVLPGAIFGDSGQRGGISSLFVRGGESTYNKLIVDGVAVDTPGQTTDFGVIPLTEADRLEFVRGAQSTLYGTDAMTSVIQVWTRAGSTAIPELRLSADGGNFGTANGNASLSGAWNTSTTTPSPISSPPTDKASTITTPTPSRARTSASPSPIRSLSASTSDTPTATPVSPANSASTDMTPSSTPSALRTSIRSRPIPPNTRTRTISWAASSSPSIRPPDGNIASPPSTISTATTTSTSTAIPPASTASVISSTMPPSNTITSIASASNIKATTPSAPGPTPPSATA